MGRGGHPVCHLPWNKHAGNAFRAAQLFGANEVEGGGAQIPSTIIQKSSYDPETRVLSVWLLTNGKQYDYRDVPPETYGAFRAAFSKDRFFNRHIRTRFVFRQVDNDGSSASSPAA